MNEVFNLKFWENVVVKLPVLDFFIVFACNLRNIHTLVDVVFSVKNLTKLVIIINKV
jgi:hypothetical protein